MLAFELEELLLGLMDLFVLDVLGLDLSLRNDFVFASVQDNALDDGVGRYCNGGSDQGADYVSYHNFICTI